MLPRNPGLLQVVYGTKVSSTVYGRTVDKDTGRKQIKCTWLFYSCELELNFSAIKETSMALILKYVLHFGNASPGVTYGTKAGFILRAS
jgi:hypothetical protein